jgi:uncharacterized membrane protein
MFYKSLISRSLKLIAFLVLSLSFSSLSISSPASASRYSCGTYGGGSYKTSECPKKGILAPLSGLGGPILIILAIGGIGGGVSLFVATKRRRDNRLESDR